MYKTTIHIVILSEDPIPDHYTLGEIERESMEGSYVADFSTPNTEEKLTDNQMANALVKAGSEPGFFMLDEDGNRGND